MTVDSPLVQLAAAATRAGLVALFGPVQFHADDLESLGTLGEGEEAEVRFSLEGAGLGVMFVDVHDSGSPEDGGLTVGLHTPSEVKAAVTGYGAADKRQVTTMVTRILRLDAPPKPADAADALALALCHAWRGGVGAVAGGAGARAGAGARVAGTAATTSVAVTPAQRAWAEAERRAR